MIIFIKTFNYILEYCRDDDEDHNVKFSVPNNPSVALSGRGIL